ncbi:MAG: hypothetical protein EPO65_03340 [Dehalococcoidia bacterium]|nr:MAG: hypothetical protein EPO65_03340 [Dehalococcoidia bacterium]
MAKPEQIKDPALRAQIEQAFMEMRSGQGGAAVKTLAAAYLAMLAQKPSMLDETIELRPGRKMPAVMRWPALGANLTLESVLAKQPDIVFEREKFAVSEAITYYEFTLDSAISAGL